MHVTGDDPPIDPQEVERAVMLDACFAGMQAEATELQREQARQILAKHPELQSLLECLASLDNLARPVRRPAGGAAGGSGPDADRAGSFDEFTPPAEGGGLASAEPTVRFAASSGDFGSGSSDGASLPADSSLWQTLPAEFGSYELVEEIGRGGMGVVYRARHRTLRSSVALKMIRSSRWASREEVRRFYQEARAAAALSHSNIIRVHDVGEHEGLHYLTMDLIDGSTLSQWIEGGEHDPDRCAELIAAVARAVHYLHTQGMIHRDLKPANILLDSSGTPYVTDFGLAKVFTSEADQTSSGTILGTPCYMSPEQAWGHAHEISPRSDVYSLGAILYELLCGRPPFREDNPIEVLLRVRESEPLPPSHWNRSVPRELEQICLRCLEKDPERRYDSAERLADDLERFRRGEPLDLPPSGLLHRLRRWARREPGLAARAVGIAIGGSIEQAYYMLGAPGGRDHWLVMSVLATWGLVSCFCQWFLNRRERAAIVPYLWGAADAILYTLAVMLAAEPRELLVIGYPLLIVASGFWIRVELVAYMTAVCLAAFGTVYWKASDVIWPAHYPFLLAGIIGLVGTFVAYQVHRLRVLNRYFERRG